MIAQLGESRLCFLFLMSNVLTKSLLYNQNVIAQLSESRLFFLDLMSNLLIKSLLYNRHISSLISVGNYHPNWLFN